MTTILVLGDGPSLSMALEVALRGSGVVLAASRHVPEVVEALDLGATIMRELERVEARPLAPLPTFTTNLRNFAISRLQPQPRTGKRQREQRTKRGR